MWIVTPTMLIDGAYTATATATDRAGNEADASVTFSVDSAMPSVSITAPADMSATNDATLGIGGLANPNIVVAVTVRDAAGMTVATATATADAQGMWTLQLTDALADGAYEVTATVTLPNGRTATQTSDVTVDTMAPAIALLTPAAGLTGQSAVVISGTAEPGATVNVIIDGMTVSTITADAQGAWTYTANPALADGAHTISAETTDAAGNQSSATPVEITVDTMAPALAVIAPAADETVTVSTPTISGTAEPGATVTVTVDGQVVGTATAGADGMWSIIPSAALAEGEREIVVVAADAAGNMSPPVTVTITIDATPAAPVAITSPVNNTQVDGPSLTVTGTGEPGATITVFVDNAQAGQTTVNPDGTWSVSVPVTAGQRTIRADQGDASAAVLVTVRGADPVDPEDEDLVLTGGPGCASAPGAPAAPTSLLGLLGLLGLGLIRRRRVA
jgi:MYXO-CTERM domain-containing protein